MLSIHASYGIFNIILYIPYVHKILYYGKLYIIYTIIYTIHCIHQSTYYIHFISYVIYYTCMSIVQKYPVSHKKNLNTYTVCIAIDTTIELAT